MGNGQLKSAYKNITTDAGYESEENYLFLESNGQLSYIRSANYEISKTRNGCGDWGYDCIEILHGGSHVEYDYETKIIHHDAVTDTVHHDAVTHKKITETYCTSCGEVKDIKRA